MSPKEPGLQHRRLNVSRISIAILGLLFAACTSTAGTTSTTTATPTSTTTLATTTTTPVQTTVASVNEMEGAVEPLPPGTYTHGPFTPPVTFVVSGEWYPGHLDPGFFDIQSELGTSDAIAVQFADVDAVFGAEPAAIAATSAADAADVLASNPELTVVATDQSRIGGLDGHVVEVENPGPGSASIIEVPPGTLTIDAGRSLWVAFFDTPDGLVAVMVGGSTDEWEEALAAAEPVLETVTIGE